MHEKTVKNLTSFQITDKECDTMYTVLLLTEIMMYMLNKMSI